jgi:uncharacterized phage protein gp47/JayE
VSYAAEPYAVFVEDVLANLTGGVSRVRFRFVEEELPFRLGAHERVLPESLRVTGLVGGEFATFVRERDYRYAEDDTIEFLKSELDPRVPAAGAVWPDLGTDVWVGFDRRPGGAAPTLNDRNPGSITRTLAESFAREYAVLSHQLELVYDAAFVATSSGRDLEQLAALVGLERRGATHARGEVLFRRTTPATADIAILAGTLVSTGPTAPVQVTVETTETVTLRRGTVSIAAPVEAQQPGPAGVAAATTLTVIHRPIFGVEDAFNPEPLSFGGGSETDAALRGRITRAMETSGRSTVGALKGALAALDGIDENDVLVEEDHLASPGVVFVTVAAEVDPTTAVLASRALEEARPAGVRVVHNLPAPTVLVPSLSEDTGGGGDGPVAGINLDGVFMPLAAAVTVTPADAQLTTDQRDRLALDVRAATLAAVDSFGVGEPVVYNRIVAAVMSVPGVLDGVVEIGPQGGELKRFNLRAPTAGVRAKLDDADLTVAIRGERVVLDVSVVVDRQGLAASAETESALATIRTDIEQRLVAALLVTPPVLSPGALIGLLPATADYEVTSLSYRLELLDEGVRVARTDVTLPLDPGQVVWIRSVSVTEPVIA